MSILAVDFGSVHTRAVLIDQIGGTFELVGFTRTRTTDTYPAQNVKVGFDRVLAQLTEVTGRKFVGIDGEVITPELPDRSGVDTFVVTASGGRPLRAVVAGLMPDLSIRAAIEALSNTYVDVVEILTLADGRTADERLNAVLHSYPNVVLIVGGTDGGASNSVLDIARSVKLAISVMDKRRRPTVIYAGNAALDPAVSAMFEGTANLLLAPNVRPQPEKKQINPTRALLAEAFHRYSETRGMGFAELAALSGSGVQPSAHGYMTVAGYLAKLNGEKVVALDIGSAACVLSVASPRSTDFAIRTDLGVGHNAPNLLSAVGSDTIRRWLPFEASDADIYNYVTNKSLRPGTVPFSLRETYLEHALLKSAAGAVAASAGIRAVADAGLVVVGGAPINETGHPGYSALLAIDSLGLTGVTKIWGDPYGLTAAIGAVAATRAEAVAQVIDEGGYTLLATTVCIGGRVRFDKPAVQVTVESEHGERTTMTVNGGHLAAIPIAVGEQATVRIKTLARGLSLAGKTAMRIKLTGGGAGLIIDARGRPLPLELTTTQRAILMPQWIAEVTGDERREIPTSLLDADSELQLPPPQGDDDEPSRVRQRQARRAQRRGRGEQQPETAAEEQTIEDLRNALS